MTNHYDVNSRLDGPDAKFPEIIMLRYCSHFHIIGNDQPLIAHFVAQDKVITPPPGKLVKSFCAITLPRMLPSPVYLVLVRYTNNRKSPLRPVKAWFTRWLTLSSTTPVDVLKKALPTGSTTAERFKI